MRCCLIEVLPGALRDPVQRLPSILHWCHHAHSPVSLPSLRPCSRHLQVELWCVARMVPLATCYEAVVLTSLSQAPEWWRELALCLEATLCFHVWDVMWWWGSMCVPACLPVHRRINQRGPGAERASGLLVSGRCAVRVLSVLRVVVGHDSVSVHNPCSAGVWSPFPTPPPLNCAVELSLRCPLTLRQPRHTHTHTHTHTCFISWLPPHHPPPLASNARAPSPDGV